MRLSVSILNSKDKINMIKTLNNTKISYIHIDVMDGLFVSQKSLPSDEIIKISPFSSKSLDIHLMVENPMYYIERIKELPNIDNITIHLEINKDIKNIEKKTGYNNYSQRSYSNFSDLYANNFNENNDSNSN